MAIRRMFSKDVVFTDDFLDMPMSARLLYFSLGMWADDDGFVDAPKSVQRQCGATDDDMKVLLAKRYVIQFENGIIVIRHWHMNNYLRQDRYKETIHLEEKAYLELEDGKYTMVDTRYTSGIPTVYPDKDSIGKNSIGYNNPPIIPPTEGDGGGPSAKSKSSKKNSEKYDALFEEFWEAFPRRRRGAKQKCRKKYETILKNNNGLTPERLLSALERQKQSKDWTKEQGEYVPSPLTWLNQGRWEDEIYDGSGDPYEYLEQDELESL